MKSGLLLDVVIGKGTAILKLLSSKDQPLLIWRDTLFVLNLSLNVVNGVGGFHLKGDGLAGQSFYEYLHLFNHKKETSKSGTLIKNRKESKPELHNQ